MQRENQRLRAVTVVVMMTVMMGPGRERRACKHHQKERCCK
jgi:hypothetical protein